MAASYGQLAEKKPEALRDLAYTLSNRREHLPYRAFATEESIRIWAAVPVVKAGSPPNIIMVFTGQGAQWPRMGLEPLSSSDYPVFKKTIQALDHHLQSMSSAPTWTIEGEIRKPVRTGRVDSAELSQPLCTATQIALVDTLASLGITPAAVVGHSSGEIAAAYAAGAIQRPKEAIRVAFHRGHVVTRQRKARRHGCNRSGLGRGSESYLARV